MQIGDKNFYKILFFIVAAAFVILAIGIIKTPGNIAGRQEAILTSTINIAERLKALESRFPVLSENKKYYKEDNSVWLKKRILKDGFSAK